MPPEHSAWAPFPRHAGQGLQALTAKKGDAAALPAAKTKLATGGARLARQAEPPLQRSVAARGQSSWQAPPHPTYPHRATTRVLQTGSTRQRAAHNSGSVPGSCRHTRPQHSNTHKSLSGPASDPRTACPPDRFKKKRSAACGAAEVYRSEASGQQKAQKHPNAKPTPQTPEPPAHATTPKTKWCVACGAAGVCRGAGKAKGKAHDNVTTAPGTEPPDKRVYINMRAKSSSPPRTARHTSQSE